MREFLRSQTFVNVIIVAVFAIPLLSFGMAYAFYWLVDKIRSRFE